MQVIKSVSLFYTEGSSDKVYHTQLCETNGGFVVNFQYGRRNSTLQSGTKTTEPVPKEKAEKTFEKLVNEKMAKGYTPKESGEVFSTQEFSAKKSDIVAQLLNAIEENEVESYLNNDDFIAQEKYNGERRFVVCKDGQVTGVNRKGLEVQLPSKISDQFTQDMVVDGEIIGDNIYLFDILSFNGKDLKNKTLTERLKVLNSLKFKSNVSIVATSVSGKEKRDLLAKVKSENGEGVVFKNKSGLYVGGKPTAKGSNNLKFKFYKTATFLVANLTKNKRSVGLVVLDGNKEVEVGKVTILPNFPVPAVGSLVEVQYLYAYKGGAVYQPVYLGERTDLEKTDASISQLVYKNEEE